MNIYQPQFPKYAQDKSIMYISSSRKKKLFHPAESVYFIQANKIAATGYDQENLGTTTTKANGAIVREKLEHVCICKFHRRTKRI